MGRRRLTEVTERKTRAGPGQPGPLGRVIWRRSRRQVAAAVGGLSRSVHVIVHSAQGRWER